MKSPRSCPKAICWATRPYKTAISKSLEGLSPDGLIPEDGAATALKALAAYQADFDAAKIDVSKVWTNDFARRANEKYPNG